VAKKIKKYDGVDSPGYPMTLPLVYRVYRRGVSGTNTGDVCETGSGRTLNMSRSGVLFEADRELDEGMAADLLIAWPTSLSTSVGLTLRVRGLIVRADRNRIALTMTRYEFRTRSIPAASERGVSDKDRAAG
jgi:hypothetical protein